MLPEERTEGLCVGKKGRRQGVIGSGREPGRDDAASLDDLGARLEQPRAERASAAWGRRSGPVAP